MLHKDKTGQQQVKQLQGVGASTSAHGSANDTWHKFPEGWL
jgi:hypothetical protein